MFSKQSKIFRNYYFFSGALMLSLISYITFEFWKKGMLNSDSDAQVYESIALARELKENQSLEQIKSDVLRNNISNAAINLEKIESSISEISLLKSKKSNDSDLKQKSNDLKESISRLATYPSTTILIQVMKEKITKFQMFVNEKHWPTLGRICERMIQLSHNLSPINFDSNSRIIRNLQAEILSIREVSEKSVLSLENKALINLRLKSVEAELKMIADFIDDQRIFLASHEKYKKIYTSWINAVIPELALRKKSISSYSKDFLQYLIGTSAVGFFLIVIGALLAKYLSRREEREGAMTLKEMIEGHLIVNHYRGHPDFSPELDKILASYHHYFQKRMNLGLLFQESLPVPAIVVDSNYKVSWANKSFIEAWEIDENDVRDEKLSWDFAKRFTNLDSIDPIVSAFKEKVAGIFEIKLQTTLKGKNLPYEMFVTPVESSSGTKVVAYFYPLTKHVDGMDSLQKEILEPITEGLELIQSGNFSGDRIDNLNAKFKNIKSMATFEKLQQLNLFVQNTRDSLLGRITDLERDLQDKIQEAQSAILQKNEFVINSKNLQAKMKNLKSHVIEQSEEFNHFGEKLDQLQISSQNLIDDSKLISSLNEEMLIGLRDHAAPIIEMVKIKDGFKVMKDELLGSRNKIMSYFDQVQMFENTQNILDQERLAHLINRLKREMLEMDKNLISIDRKMRDLDIHLTKAELMTADVAKKVDHQAPALANNSRLVSDKMTNLFAECRELSTQVGHLELIMIRDFEDIHALLKKARILEESSRTSVLSSSRPRELSTM
jgi:hypothetical protein